MKKTGMDVQTWELNAKKIQIAFVTILDKGAKYGMDPAIIISVDGGERLLFRNMQEIADFLVLQTGCKLRTAKWFIVDAFQKQLKDAGPPPFVTMKEIGPGGAAGLN